MAKRGRKTQGSLASLAARLEKLDAERRAVVAGIRAATDALVAGEVPLPWRFGPTNVAVSLVDEATMTPKSLSAELLERAAKEAEQSAHTVDAFTAEALERELARRSFQRLKGATERRRHGMTDEQVDERVNSAVQEYRAEQRSR